VGRTRGACLHEQLDGLLQGEVLLVVLLQQVRGSLVVGANGGGLPPAVVAAGVALIQLVTPLLIPVTGVTV